MDSTLRHKIGQKFAIGFPGTELTPELREAILTYHFGNIILFRENLVDEAQTRRLCRDLDLLITEVTGERPIISIDQEGGMVTRLADDSLNIPGQMALAATGDPALARRMNEINARMLLDLGFSMNLSPVLDTNTEPDNPVIGNRSFGDTPEQVGRFGLAAIDGMREAGILSSAKHFPGHGNTKVDSHVGLPLVDADRASLDEVELKPFRLAVTAGVDAIMTTHILFPALEPERLPATMSRRILTGLLRDAFRYDGLIISDCMEMEAIATHYGTVNGVLQGFAAGVDLMFISHTLEKAIASFEATYAAYEQGLLPLDELEDSCARLRVAKGLIRRPAPLTAEDYAGFRAEIRAALRRSFCVRKGTETSAELYFCNSAKGMAAGETLILGPLPYRATNVSNVDQAPVSFAPDLARLLSEGERSAEGSAGEGSNGSYRGLVTSIDGSDLAEVLAEAQKADRIILGTYNAHVYLGQLKLLDALLALGKPLLVVALRNPYDLMYVPVEQAALAIFEYTPKSIRELADCLKGREVPGGRMPVEIPERAR